MASYAKSLIDFVKRKKRGLAGKTIRRGSKINFRSRCSEGQNVLKQDMSNHVKVNCLVPIWILNKNGYFYTSTLGGCQEEKYLSLYMSYDTNFLGSLKKMKQYKFRDFLRSEVWIAGLQRLANISATQYFEY